MITFPLTIPDNLGANHVVFHQRTLVGMSQSPFAGSQQTYEWPGEWFEADFNLPPMKRSTAAAWVAFLVSLRGRLGTFLVGDPSAQSPLGSAPGSPVVNGANQTGISLATRGWTANRSGILLPGDYISVGAGATTRLYMNLTQANSDSSGNATLDIFPTLRESPGDGAVIATANTKGTFRLAENKTDWDISAAMHLGLAFKAIEAF